MIVSVRRPFTGILLIACWSLIVSLEAHFTASMQRSLENFDRKTKIQETLKIMPRIKALSLVATIILSYYLPSAQLKLLFVLFISGLTALNFQKDTVLKSLEEFYQLETVLTENLLTVLRTGEYYDGESELSLLTAVAYEHLRNTPVQFVRRPVSRNGGRQIVFGVRGRAVSFDFVRLGFVQELQGYVLDRWSESQQEGVVLMRPVGRYGLRGSFVAFLKRGRWSLTWAPGISVDCKEGGMTPMDFSRMRLVPVVPFESQGDLASAARLIETSPGFESFRRDRLTIYMGTTPFSTGELVALQSHKVRNEPVLLRQASKTGELPYYSAFSKYVTTLRNRTVWIHRIIIFLAMTMRVMFMNHVSERFLDTLMERDQYIVNTANVILSNLSVHLASVLFRTLTTTLDRDPFLRGCTNPAHALKLWPVLVVLLSGILVLPLYFIRTEQHVAKHPLVVLNPLLTFLYFGSYAARSTWLWIFANLTQDFTQKGLTLYRDALDRAYVECSLTGDYSGYTSLSLGPEPPVPIQNYRTFEHRLEDLAFGVNTCFSLIMGLLGTYSSFLRSRNMVPMTFGILGATILSLNRVPKSMLPFLLPTVMNLFKIFVTGPLRIAKRAALTGDSATRTFVSLVYDSQIQYLASCCYGPMLARLNYTVSVPTGMDCLGSGILTCAMMTWLLV